MSSWLGGGGGAAAASSSSPSDLQSKKEQLKMQIQQELAVANAQQLVNKMNDNCFTKCITKPSTSLSSSEEQCLTRCMTLYMQAFDQVSRSYIARVQKEKDLQGLGGAGL